MHSSRFCKLDAAEFDIIKLLSPLGLAEELVSLLVDLHWLVLPALVVSKHRLLIVLIIVLRLEGRSWELDKLDIVELLGLLVVIVFDVVHFFLEELVKILVLLLCKAASKGTHLYIKCIHSAAHGVDKLWLIWIYEAVDLVVVHNLVLFALLVGKLVIKGVEVQCLVSIVPSVVTRLSPGLKTELRLLVVFAKGDLRGVLELLDARKLLHSLNEVVPQLV